MFFRAKLCTVTTQCSIIDSASSQPAAFNSIFFRSSCQSLCLFREKFRYLGPFDSQGVVWVIGTGPIFLKPFHTLSRDLCVTFFPPCNKLLSETSFSSSAVVVCMNCFVGTSVLARFYFQHHPLQPSNFKRSTPNIG